MTTFYKVSSPSGPPIGQSMAKSSCSVQLVRSGGKRIEATVSPCVHIMLETGPSYVSKVSERASGRLGASTF